MNAPPYLSHSQMDLYLKDPAGYYRNYILGIKPEPTKPMLLGGIAHKAFADRKFDYAKELRIAGFLPDTERVLRTALLDIPTFPITETKVKCTVAIDDIRVPLLGIFDALEQSVLIEFKYGAPWSQQRADEASQLTFYWIMHTVLYQVPEAIILYSINSKTGKVVKFTTTRTPAQVEEVKALMKFAWLGIHNGMWQHNFAYKSLYGRY